MKLIADSGSTKTDFCLIQNGTVKARYNTKGINPYHQSISDIKEILCNLNSMLMSEHDIESGRGLSLHFYGSGCNDDKIAMMTEILSNVFSNVERIEVNSDLFAAAHSLCGHSEGIACILGTGSNSCLYDGRDIIKNIPPLGYILGDEGSGAVLGRNFINAIFKERLSKEIREDFLKTFNLTYSEVISKVYTKTMPNRFLASLTHYIKDNIKEKGIRILVIDNFRTFITNNIEPYNRKDLPVNAVGSIAKYFIEEFKEALNAEGYKIGVIQKSPMNGLIEYHK